MSYPGPSMGRGGLTPVQRNSWCILLPQQTGPIIKFISCYSKCKTITLHCKPDKSNKKNLRSLKDILFMFWILINVILKNIDEISTEPLQNINKFALNLYKKFNNINKINFCRIATNIYRISKRTQQISTEYLRNLNKIPTHTYMFSTNYYKISTKILYKYLKFYTKPQNFYDLDKTISQQNLNKISPKYLQILLISTKYLNLWKIIDKFATKSLQSLCKPL